MNVLCPSDTYSWKNAPGLDFIRCKKALKVKVLLLATESFASVFVSPMF